MNRSHFWKLAILPGLVMALFPCVETVEAGPLRRFRFERVNRKLYGVIIDHTANHGADRRIWSEALCQKRDLYVYLPPGFDPCRRYPLLIWLHGFIQDERAFLSTFVQPFDQAIADGRLPPLIIAAPDGTINNRVGLLVGNSFFLNSKAGAFEDYLIHDVWNFLISHYPIHPAPEAHVLAGMSMGGFASFNQSFKHPDRFKTAVGIFPPLNLRWVDCHCRYMANFDPCCWGWRMSVRNGREVIGRFYGIVFVRLKRLIDPLYDRNDPATIYLMSLENPTEMISRLGIGPDTHNLYIGYGGKDEFNIDAQVESFLYVAREHHLPVRVDFIPNGRHNLDTAIRFLPNIIDWLAPILAPYSPEASVENLQTD